MNTRCYRCGNSFSLSREVVEAAVAAAGPDDKFYVAYCPRCRTANKVPLQQLRRTLPAGWTAPAATEAPEPEAPPAPEPAAPSAEAAPPAKAPRKRASKTTEAAPAPSPEATPAAKKASRSKAKPS